MSFSWSNVPAVTARKVAAGLGLPSGDPVRHLTSRFGRTPNEDFVAEAWSLLRDEWLTRDSPAAKQLAQALLTRNVGSRELPTRNHEQRLAYLRSCRLSKAVREETLRVFLAVHDGAIARAAAPQKPDRERPARGADQPAPRRPQPRRVTTDEAADPVADMNNTLRRLHRDDVPSLAFNLMVLCAMTSERETLEPLEELPASVASSLMMALVMGELEADHQLARSKIAEVGMPEDVARTASHIARGGRQWHHERSPVELLMTVDGLVTHAISQGLTADRGRVIGAGLALQVISTGGGDRSISLEDAGRLLGWTRQVMAAEATEQPTRRRAGGRPDPAPHRPQVEPRPAQYRPARGASPVTTRTVDQRKGQWHANVITALSTIEPDEPIEDIDGGGRWWASSAGGTAVWAGAKVNSHGHRVQPVMVDTSIRPTRRLAEAQLLAALSDLNIHGGIAQVAWVDGCAHFRSSIAVHSGITGWTGPWAAVAMYASATAAWHVPTELKGGVVDGPFGHRSKPNHLIADFTGWDVPEEEQHRFVLPTRAIIASALDRLPRGMAKYKVRPTEVEVRLAGPNGRLEGFLGRRGGRSDDQELVVSAVTRPPWGAGVKFVLRIETGQTEMANHRLASEANLVEWELIPSLNVWGGWAGEDGCVRLTSFVPQMLMASDVEGSTNVVVNMLLWVITRANTIAVAIGG